MSKKIGTVSCVSKYEFTPDMADTGLDYSEVVTVPDQVMTMYDIYTKYAVRGEIAGLANNIRPHVQDDLDDFDEAVDFVPEEDLDILQRSRALRMASDNRSDENDSEEDKSDTKKTPGVEGAEPPEETPPPADEEKQE